MDRSDLGTFGAGLPEGQLAQALAAMGVLAGGGSASWAPVDLQWAEQELLARCGADGVCEVTSWWLPPDSQIAHDPAPELAEAWRRFLKHRPEPRLEVQPANDPEVSAWLARQCRHAEVGAGAVYQRVDEPDWPVAWEWPLRLGVLGSASPAPRERQLHAALATVRFDNLWTVVDMEQPGAECELLLLAGGLPQALADVLQAAQRPRADCVLVLDAHRTSPGRLLALATALRREARTSGVALLATGGAVADVLTQTVRELSHDATLDVALFRAVRSVRARQAVDAPPLLAPQLLFSRNLARHSSVRRTAARMAAEYAGDPQLAGAAKHLEDLAARGPFHAESGDASDVVKIRGEARRKNGRTHRIPKMTAAAAAPPPIDQPDEREVLAQVTPHGATQPASDLRADTAYRLRVRIAVPQAGFVASGTAFPSHQLPPSAAGHELQLTFVPLSADAAGRIERPQQKLVFLPPEGPSDEAEFTFTTHGIAGSYAARLIVSFGNRVLQLLRLQGELDASRPYGFEVENLVHPGFQNLAYQPGFDAALVVNHSTDGRPGVTALAGASVDFVAPEGLGRMLDKLQGTLTNETALRRTDAGLDTEPLTDLLFALMQHGRLLFDFLQPVLGALDTDAGRIQVVEARSGAFFPAEFLYPLRVPQAKPPLCPNAANALVGETAHQRCPHKDDPQHMCPLRFWGFRKQIERQPASVTSGGAATVLRVPTPQQGRLDLFRAAQVARSNKVQAPDFDLPEGLLKVLHGQFGSVNVAAKWDDWAHAVETHSPGFLLLLSHSTADAVSELPALEISKDVLSVGSLEDNYVRGPQAPAPVVFLLGCETADPKIGFLNFVERFKRKQAALVVGTLSTISAQRAARFLALALPMFKAAEHSGRSFGDVFLDVKRAALARGDGFVLSLVAYGDTGWQL